jgi:hypothetical protein
MAGGVKIIDQAVKTTGDLDVGGAIKDPKINRPAHTDFTAGSDTATIAEVLTGILEVDPAADITWTLPTAALAVAGIANVSVGDCIDLSIINSGSATADEIITIAMGTGGTAVGYHGVKCSGVAVGDCEGSGLFRIRFTNVTSGSEAYVSYRIA